MEVAAELGAEKVVLHPWFANGLGVMMVEMSRERGLAALDQLILTARQLNLRVCLENLFPRSKSLVSPSDFVPVVTKYPELNLTLDTGHAHIGGGNGRILEFLVQFQNRIGHIHVSDNHGRNDDHLPIGAGLIDFKGLTDNLREIGYDQTVTFEVFSPDRGYLLISREKFVKMVREAASR
jgi:sugar phosphate isomerase/epimerase